MNFNSIKILETAENTLKYRLMYKIWSGVRKTNASHALSMTMQCLSLLEKSSGQRLYIRYKHLHPELENKGTIAELILPALFY